MGSNANYEYIRRVMVEEHANEKFNKYRRLQEQSYELMKQFNTFHVNAPAASTSKESESIRLLDQLF